MCVCVCVCTLKLLVEILNFITIISKLKQYLEKLTLRNNCSVMFKICLSDCNSLDRPAAGKPREPGNKEGCMSSLG